MPAADVEQRAHPLQLARPRHPGAQLLQVQGEVTRDQAAEAPPGRHHGVTPVSELVAQCLPQLRETGKAEPGS
jgi:hypothetical protein